ncbi:MAG: YeiH family protein [Gammaproteobacteria bacterium]
MPLAFVAILSASPILGIVSGIIYAFFFNSDKNSKKKFLGTNFLQIGIIFLGLTLSFSNSLTITQTYLPAIAIQFLLIITFGFLISKLFKLKRKLIILIISGTAICGITAMAAVSTLIKVKSKYLFLSISIIFMFNILAIILFPIIGGYLNISEETFGAWVALSIHDTSSVIGASMIYGPSALETATLVKLIRTLWLIPLMILLGFFYEEKNKTKIQLPTFVLIFILAVLSGSFLDFNDQYIYIFESISKIFIVAALFCIGMQIPFKSILETKLNIFLYSSIMWVIAIVISLILVI